MRGEPQLVSAKMGAYRAGGSEGEDAELNSVLEKAGRSASGYELCSCIIACSDKDSASGSWDVSSVYGLSSGLQHALSSHMPKSWVLVII